MDQPGAMESASLSAELTCKLAEAETLATKFKASLAATTTALTLEKSLHAKSVAASTSTISDLKRSLKLKEKRFEQLEVLYKSGIAELAFKRTGGPELAEQIAELEETIDANNAFTEELKDELEELKFRTEDNADREAPAAVQNIKLKAALQEKQDASLQNLACISELKDQVKRGDAIVAGLMKDLASADEALQGEKRGMSVCLASVLQLEGEMAKACRTAEGFQRELEAAKEALEAEEEEHSMTKGIAKLKWKVAARTREDYEVRRGALPLLHLFDASDKI